MRRQLSYPVASALNLGSPIARQERGGTQKPGDPDSIHIRHTGSFHVRAYVGDNKTLLAFSFTNPAAAKNLAGFTITVSRPSAGYIPGTFLKSCDLDEHAEIPVVLAQSLTLLHKVST